MAEDDSPMSARDRRRQRAKANAPSGAARTFRQYRVHLAILLIFGAIVAAMVVNARSGPDCPGHWHSSQDVFVHGERVSFNHPKFTLEAARSYGGSMPVSSHMHQGDDAMWHFEPSTADTCIPYGDALRFIDMQLSPDELVLRGGENGAHDDAPLDQAGTYRDGDNGTLRAEHRVGDGEWEDISIRALLDRQLRPDERVIIRFDNGTVDAEELRSVADGHSIQGSSGTGGGSYVPAVGVGILGLVVLGGWHMLSRKA